MRLDEPTKTLLSFVSNLKQRSLSQQVKESAVRHFLDTIGCAFGGYHSQPAKIGRQLAATGTSGAGASVMGMPGRTTPEYAAFANACMVRYLDYNDVYVSVGGTHPSDMIPALVALAEPLRTSGADLILAIYAAYEVITELGDAIPIRAKGWDQGAIVTISTAIGAAVILDLTPEQTVHAVSLAMTPSMPLRVTRAGELSHWKGCAAAHAAMTSILAARLAKFGMTGPSLAFEGVDGFWKQVSGPFELSGLGVPRNALSGLERTAYKAFPAELDSQGPLRAFRALRQRFSVDAVKQIKVSMRWAGWHEAGGGQGDRAEKWDPKTRETADHSLPYLLAVMLVDGKIDAQSFSPQRISDPALRPIMNKIDILEDKELTALNLDELVSKIVIDLKSGERIEEVARYPGALPVNPLTDEEIVSKFRSLSDPVIGAEQSEQIHQLVWKLDRLSDVNELTDLYRRMPSNA